MKRKTILLYGRTRSGKTAQISELAKWVKLKTGLDTLVYTIDKGGYDVLQPHIDLGFVHVVEQEATSPWLFLHKASTGMIRSGEKKWTKADLTKYGLVAFEGLTPFADTFMNDLAEQSARGVSIGGEGNVSFKVTSDDETISIGGNNRSHYNIVQNQITKGVWESQKLQVPYILWTASVSKDDDAINTGKVLGPAVVGKALTSEVPRWFQYTFRIDAVPAQNGKEERHILYLGMSTDLTAGNAVSLGNTRAPLGVKLPATIEPASITKVLELIATGENEAKEAIRREFEASTSSAKLQ